MVVTQMTQPGLNPESIQHHTCALITENQGTPFGDPGREIW